MSSYAQCAALQHTEIDLLNRQRGKVGSKGIADNARADLIAPITITTLVTVNFALTAALIIAITENTVIISTCNEQIVQNKTASDSVDRQSSTDQSSSMLVKNPDHNQPIHQHQKQTD